MAHPLLFLIAPMTANIKGGFMKGFFNHLFTVSILTISLSGIAHAQATFNPNSNVASVFQNANLPSIINRPGYTEDHAREVCTSGIRADNQDQTCQDIISNCQRVYGINAQSNPFDCSAQSTNGFFACAVDPTKPFNGFQSVDDETKSQFINGLKNACGVDLSSAVVGRVPFQPNPNLFGALNPGNGNAGTPTPDPAADPVTPPAGTDNSANSDTANPSAAAPTMGSNANAGASSGCSLSPLQSGAPMGDLSLLSTLVFIPLALRMRKKKQD